ncbi:hypothetical protein H0B56_14620 [Haloechinothrix sp. YIM 98757]|uniref:Uncharacterized protein n=1 Tax=Haloechinothrix aidingensis TaxID=2752311 RepID=A0A838AC27_9PSEU|nr:hypothetical protein [Haloechinothrix aidingensis]MBA0126781.1 hypothetical protein [Haloechinothrix aidingensis]
MATAARIREPGPAQRGAHLPPDQASIDAAAALDGISVPPPTSSKITSMRPES